MVQQNLTSFTILVVLLGAVLAVAVFRPQILPVEAVQSPSPTPQIEGNTLTPVPDEGGTVLLENQPLSEEELNERKRELDQRQAELNGREAELDQRESKLKELQGELDHRQAELDEREIGLNQRQIELREQEATLRAGEEHLTTQSTLLNEKLASLRSREANLAEREGKLEGRIRLALVAASISALLAVPSVLVLIARIQQNRGMPTRDGQPIRLPQPSRRERRTHPGEPATVMSASIHGGNGRYKESACSATGRQTRGPYSSERGLP
jgi:multidrug efflux pump subunit AcrA (membrane-fusion protein)